MAASPASKPAFSNEGHQLSRAVMPCYSPDGGCIHELLLGPACHPTLEQANKHSKPSELFAKSPRPHAALTVALLCTRYDDSALSLKSIATVPALLHCVRLPRVAILHITPWTLPGISVIRTAVAGNSFMPGLISAVQVSWSGGFAEILQHEITPLRVAVFCFEQCLYHLGGSSSVT